MKLNNIVIECPHCKEKTNVLANVISFDFINMPVATEAEAKETYLLINWEEAQAECNFNYICENCEGLIAGSLEELEKLLEER